MSGRNLGSCVASFQRQCTFSIIYIIYIYIYTHRSKHPSGHLWRQDGVCEHRLPGLSQQRCLQAAPRVVEAKDHLVHVAWPMGFMEQHETTWNNVEKRGTNTKDDPCDEETQQTNVDWRCNAQCFSFYSGPTAGWWNLLVLMESNWSCTKSRHEQTWLNLKGSRTRS